jgi:hypothetical protein
MFCVSLAARFSRQTFIFACTLAAFSLLYLSLALHYILLIRRNVPTSGLRWWFGLILCTSTCYSDISDGGGDYHRVVRGIQLFSLRTFFSW